MNSYEIGDETIISGEFHDATGALADPTTVTLQTKTPGGVITLYTYGVDVGLIRDSLGKYHFVQAFGAGSSGTWFYRWAGSANPRSADEAPLFVEPSQF